MEAQFEALSELVKNGQKLNFGQDFFVKFYQAFLYSDRWQQYIKGVGTTLLVTAIALVLGVVLGAIVAMVRVGYAQQKPHHRNPILGIFNAVAQVYVTVIRGTPMMVQLLIMSMVIFASSRNFTMVGALALGINSGAYVSEIIRGGLMAVDPGQMEAGRSLGLNYMTTMFEIIIPQAIRSILPALGNEFIMLLKDSSLITVIGGKELLYAAQGIMNRTYEPMFPLLGVAATYLVLVMLCFFCSMWITNDVALLTFVPFTILVLELSGLQKEMIPVIVMQTIAANLGSMMTPVGNPQNLYLYSVSGMGMGEFFSVMGPLSALSFLLILGACIFHKNFVLDPELLKHMEPSGEAAGKSSKTAEAASGNAVPKRLRNLQNLLLATLFLFSLLSVFRVISWPVLVVVVLTGCLLLIGAFHSSFLPKKVDYSLLLTFIAFFVFIGNMKRIDLIREFLNQTLHGRELLLSFGCSQIISNVPAAILLSGFTDQYVALLRGVNIGGLGTLIASLASLISYKFFAESQARFPEAGSKQSYILRFTIWNVGMAIILLLAAVMLDW